VCKFDYLSDYSLQNLQYKQQASLYSLQRSCLLPVTYRETKNYQYCISCNCTVLRNVQSSIGRPSAAATHVVRVEERGRKHWPISPATHKIRVCSVSGVNRKVSLKCQRCDVALRAETKYFLDSHTKASP